MKMPILDDWKWEVIVVDNASEDETEATVIDFAKTAPAPVRYVKEERLGHSFALNTGIKNTRGDIIAFTDDDAIPANDWISKISSSMKLSESDIVFGRVTPFWESSPPKWFSERFYGKFALLDYGPKTFVVKDVLNPFYGVNHAVRRQALERLGGYREDRGARGAEGGSGNDTDLFERALAVGLKIVYDPEILVQHVIPPQRCSRSHFRNLIWNSRKYYYLYVMEKEINLPQLFGLPRYRYPMTAYFLIEYIRSVLTMNLKNQFYYELELRKSFGLFIESHRQKGRIFGLFSGGVDVDRPE